MTKSKSQNLIEICGNLWKLVEIHCLKAWTINFHKFQSISINFNRTVIICILVLLSQLCFGICHYSFAQQEPSKEEEALFVAQKAFEDGFYEVSLGLLERFLKTYPSSPKLTEAELLIGQCYFHQNKFLDALAKFEGLLNKPSANFIKDALIYWIAEVHFKGNSFHKAAKYYKMIVDDFPQSSYRAAAYYSLGWCSFQEQEFKEALAYFKTVEEKYSKETQAQDVCLKIIECLYNLRDYTGLKKEIIDYLKVYSNDTVRLPYFYFYLAESDYYLNNFTEAVDEYSKVISNSRDDKMQGLSKLGLSWSYLKLKRYKEAESSFLEIKADTLEKRSMDVLLLGKAILYSETNRLNDAIKTYAELLNTTVDSLCLIQAYLGKADALYNLSEYADAIKIYQQALGHRELETTADKEIIDKLHYGLSWAFLKQGEFKEAIREFQKIVKTSDDKIVKVSALCQIGDAYQDSGDYDKAQEAYDTILKDYPDSFYNDYVQYQLGLTLLKNSNYDGAIMSFLNLKNNFPHSKLLDDASYALGLSYFQRQDYNSSREVFEKFQEEFKDSNLKPQAMYLLGTSLYNLGSFAEAIEVFKNVIRAYGQDIELVQKAEYEIADCFYQMGNEKEAMTRFKTLRSKYPDSMLTPEIMWWLGDYYYRHNDLILARRYFSSLIQDFPNSNLVADAYYALGSSYAEESGYEKAIENFKKVMALGKSDLCGQAAIAIADIYIKKDSPDLALRDYQDIIKGYPNLTNLIYPKVADLYYKMGNYEEAMVFYRRSLGVVPVREMAEIQLKIAEVLETKKDLQEAIEEYLKVTYLYAENNNLAVKAFLRVARIYEDKENFKEAINIYKKIISMGVEEAKYAQERIDWIKIYTK